MNARKGTIAELARDQELADKLKDTIIQLSALIDTIHPGQGTL
jgi:hypothetical protein